MVHYSSEVLLEQFTSINRLFFDMLVNVYAVKDHSSVVSFLTSSGVALCLLSSFCLTFMHKQVGFRQMISLMLNHASADVQVLSTTTMSIW